MESGKGVLELKKMLILTFLKLSFSEKKLLQKKMTTTAATFVR